MPDFNFQLTFAGVPFCLDMATDVSQAIPDEVTGIKEARPAVDLVAEINRLSPLCYAEEFREPAVPPGLRRLCLRRNPSEPRGTLNLGDWYYPVGATRWSVFRGLMMSSQVKAVLAATSGGPGTLVMKAAPTSPDNPQGAAAAYTLQSSLTMLPPRPLAEHGGDYDGLYLVTLVDERYHWRGRTVILSPTRNSTWSDLFNALASALGITLGFTAPAAAYGQPEPDSALSASHLPAAWLLEAAAGNCGTVVVRNLDGTYALQTADTAAAQARTNRGDPRTVIRTAGGDGLSSGPLLSKAGDLRPARNAILPATTVVAFPKYVHGDDPIPHFLDSRRSTGDDPSNFFDDNYPDSHAVTVPLASGGVSGSIGTATVLLRSTAKALYLSETSAASGNAPLNASALTALAVRLTADLCGWMAADGLDESYAGTRAWTPEGLHDIIWSYSAGRGGSFTRVLRVNWSDVPTEFQHGTPPLSGGTTTARGAAGKAGTLVVQDSRLSGVPATSVTDAATAGAASINLASVDGLPTDTRWRARVGGETVLLEGTSGGIEAGASGYSVSVVRRGDLGSVAAAVVSGAVVRPEGPNRGYGVDLLTFGPGFFAAPDQLTEGGVRGAKLLSPVQTVTVLHGSGVEVNSVRYFSGRINTYSGGFGTSDLVWLVERNAKYPTSGKLYNGQLLGYSPRLLSGAISAPVYGISNEATGLTFKDVDGSPEYTDILTVELDEDDGISLTQPAAGVVRIDLLEASATQRGIVSLDDQMMGAGIKTFDTVRLSTSDGLADPEDPTWSAFTDTDVFDDTWEWMRLGPDTTVGLLLPRFLGFMKTSTDAFTVADDNFFIFDGWSRGDNGFARLDLTLFNIDDATDGNCWGWFDCDSDDFNSTIGELDVNNGMFAWSAGDIFASRRFGIGNGDYFYPGQSAATAGLNFVGGIYTSGTVSVATANIGDAQVTNAKLANMAAWSYKIRNAATAGVPSDAQVGDFTTAAPVSGDYFNIFKSSGEIRKATFLAVSEALGITSGGGGGAGNSGQQTSGGRHDLLTHLNWFSGGHTAAAARLAGFNDAGVALPYELTGNSGPIVTRHSGRLATPIFENTALWDTNGAAGAAPAANQVRAYAWSGVLYGRSLSGITPLGLQNVNVLTSAPVVVDDMMSFHDVTDGEGKRNRVGDIVSLRAVAKTTTYTAVEGELVLASISGGSWTLTLPASPSAHARVGVKITAISGSNTLTIGRNSQSIDGTAADYVLYPCVNDYIEFEFNSTNGWAIVTKIFTPHKTSLYRDAAQTGIVSAVVTKINYDAERYDDGNIGDVANSRVVIRRPGRYRCSSSVWIGNIDNSEYVQALIYKGGGATLIAANRGYSSTAVGGGDACTGLTTVVHDFANGDVIEGYALHTEGANESTLTSSEAVKASLLVEEVL